MFLSITKYLKVNFAVQTNPQPHHMLAGVQIFIVQYVLIKERRKKASLCYYKVITQIQPEIYMFDISGKGNLPVSSF